MYSPLLLDVGLVQTGRIWRAGRGEKMAKALELEKVDEHGNTIKCLTGVTTHPARNSRQAKKQCTDPVEPAVSSDRDDLNYQVIEPAESESTSISENDVQVPPSNEEVGHLFHHNTSILTSVGIGIMWQLTCTRLLISCHPRQSLL
jgi:hypothetical protein